MSANWPKRFAACVLALAVCLVGGIALASEVLR